jgi:hypothetical protein
VNRGRRRIVLAIEPVLMQGALAKLLLEARDVEVVQLSGADPSDFRGGYDAAVVSDRLPEGVRADLVITLPDTRGSGGTGTVRSGDLLDEVTIGDAERIMELIEQYSSDSSHEGLAALGSPTRVQENLRT